MYKKIFTRRPFIVLSFLSHISVSHCIDFIPFIQWVKRVISGIFDCLSELNNNLMKFQPPLKSNVKYSNYPEKSLNFLTNHENFCFLYLTQTPIFGVYYLEHMFHLFKTGSFYSVVSWSNHAK